VEGCKLWRFFKNDADKFYIFAISQGTLSLKLLIDKHSLKEAYVLYFESDFKNVLEKIQTKFSKNLIQNFCKEEDYEYLEIEFNGNYFETLDMLKSFGLEKIKYNYDNENFSFKFEGKLCTLNFGARYHIEKTNKKDNT
jgi:hypothetical protein